MGGRFLLAGPYPSAAAAAAAEQYHTVVLVLRPPLLGQKQKRSPNLPAGSKTGSGIDYETACVIGTAVCCYGT